ncbi:Uncharacterised protein [Mycobacteroides abscessus subsp. abscessus]|nr:Uncharacterised protein [Mycobacteroides abscessus subsp. abscessus]
MSDGKDNGLQIVQPSSIFQPNALRPLDVATGVGQCHRTRAVHANGHMLGRPADNAREAIAEIVPIEGARRIGVGAQCSRLFDRPRPTVRWISQQRKALRPFIERRPGLDGPVDGHAVVGEDGDL